MTPSQEKGTVNAIGVGTVNAIGVGTVCHDDGGGVGVGNNSGCESGVSTGAACCTQKMLLLGRTGVRSNIAPILCWTNTLITPDYARAASHKFATSFCVGMESVPNRVMHKVSGLSEAERPKQRTILIARKSTEWVTNHSCRLFS